jgi:hypothetical protein
MTKKNRTGPSFLVGLYRRSTFRVPACLRNLCFLIEIGSKTFFFYCAGGAVISPMTLINTKVVEEVVAKKESPAGIAETENDVQVLRWTLVF